MNGHALLPAGLDEQTQQMIKMIEADPFLDPEHMTTEEMRKAFDTFYTSLGFPTLPVSSAEDLYAEGPAGKIRVRVYTPLGEASVPRPAVVFFHGGGMMMGSIEAYDGLCRRLSSKSDCIVISATYRLAPEHKFPSAVEDATAVLYWAREHAVKLGANPDRIAIAGESGGGNLAAVVSQRMNRLGSDIIKYQILINPAVGTNFDTPSMKLFADGYFFEPEALKWIYSLYLPDMAMASNPEVSPLFAEDLEGLPPAFIVVAGCDILRSDIEAYGRKLAGAGVPTEMSTYENTIHGFVCMSAKVEKGVQAVDECGEKLRNFFS